MQVATTYGMGPQAMPYIIATGMVLLAAGNFWLAWRGDFPARESFDPKAIVLILGGLSLLGLIVEVERGCNARERRCEQRHEEQSSDETSHQDPLLRAFSKWQCLGRNVERP
jgi:hypothetical protein